MRCARFPTRRIADTDPQFGVEAALADYDAVFNSIVDSQHNHRALNNIFFGGGTRILIQDLDTFKERNRQGNSDRHGIHLPPQYGLRPQQRAGQLVPQRLGHELRSPIPAAFVARRRHRNTTVSPVRMASPDK